MIHMTLADHIALQIVVNAPYILAGSVVALLITWAWLSK